MSALVDQYKLHESQADRRRQFEIVLAFCKARHLSALDAGDLKPWDYVIIDGTPRQIALAEVKHREHTFGTFKTYTIDEAKLREMVVAAEKANMIAILIVSWLGDLRCAEIKPELPYAVSEQRRADRDERADPVCHIPLPDFERV